MGRWARHPALLVCTSALLLLLIACYLSQQTARVFQQSPQALTDQFFDQHKAALRVKTLGASAEGSSAYKIQDHVMFKDITRSDRIKQSDDSHHRPDLKHTFGRSQGSHRITPKDASYPEHVTKFSNPANKLSSQGPALTSSVPKCTDLYQTIGSRGSQLMLLCMFDPGNCSFVTNSHLEPLDVRDDDARRITGPWGDHHLWSLCQDPLQTHNSGRVCRGMPPVFRDKVFMQSYGTDSVAKSEAIKTLGRKCFHSKTAILANPRGSIHHGGPRKVINNLLSGLRLLGKTFYFNPHDLKAYDYIVMLDDYYHFLLYHLSIRDEPWRFYLGPLVAAYQTFRIDRISKPSRDYVHVVAASPYAANKTHQYVPALPMKQENVVIIPSGVDTEFFRPNTSYMDRHPRTALFYYKEGCDQKAADQLKEEVMTLRISIIEIFYGGYSEDDFRTALHRAMFAVICDGQETQGIAAMEIMSMDVPSFVLNPLSVQYMHHSVGVIYDKEEQVVDQFQTFYKRVLFKQFTPRAWVEKHFSLVSMANYFMRILCKLNTEL